MMCIDPGYQAILNPGHALREYARDANFAACLEKLTRLGVNLESSHAWKRDTGERPIIYTILIQGADGEARQTRLHISYDLDLLTFICDQPSYEIPRCDE